MAKDYGGYFYTSKSGRRIFVPFNDNESRVYAKEMEDSYSPSKVGVLSKENLAIAKEMYKKYKKLEKRISPTWYYYHIMEEFANNLTPEEKGYPIVCREIDRDCYIAINFGHEDYKIIEIFPIDGESAFKDRLRR